MTHGAFTHAWNYRNRLTQSSAGSATTTYANDHENARVQKVSGSATTTYANRFYELANGTSTKHIFAGSELIASVRGTGSSSEMFIVHADHLGSTNVVTDESGALAQLLSYYPFGKTRLDEQAAGFDETNKFTGHELDPETSVYYMQARYQDPGIGRFVSQDPAFLDIGAGEFRERYDRTLERHLQNPQALGTACSRPRTRHDQPAEALPRARPSTFTIR